MPSPPFRFALPPSTGLDGHAGLHGLRGATAALGAYLEATLGRPVDVTVSQTYEVLTRNLLSGAVDAAWAPPLVCAKTEPEGLLVVVQTVRKGTTRYASAFVCRAEDKLSLTTLRGKRMAWVDPWSVAGYLLPSAFLKARGMAASGLFAGQMFAGSYREALAAVLGGEADVGCVHCLPEMPTSFRDAIDAHLDEVMVGAGARFALVTTTDSVPSDGVVVRPEVKEAEALKRALVGLGRAPGGAALLQQVFHAEGFAEAGKMAYRALYAIAPR